VVSVVAVVVGGVGVRQGYDDDKYVDGRTSYLLWQGHHLGRVISYWLIGLRLLVGGYCVAMIVGVDGCLLVVADSIDVYVVASYWRRLVSLDYLYALVLV
jgi:hypothetical protein